MRIAIVPMDLFVILAYLVGVVLVGCFAGFRQRRQKSADSEDYFLASKTLTWPVIGMALFSTNISTAQMISMSQEGFKNGLAWGNFEWMAIFTLIALALFFAPFYIKSNVATLPDFLERRYNRHCRDFLAFISILTAVFVHIGITLYSGAVVLKGLFGFDIMFSIVSLTLVTGLYTAVGGLLAVVLTESIQTIVLVLGSISVTAIGLWKVGGWSALTATVDPVHMSILRDSNDASGMAWYAVFLGYPVIGLWYWCADQTIVQRVLGAKDENHARVGAIFAGFIKILPVFLFVLPGLICNALIRQGKLPMLSDSAETYAHLVNHLLPVGLKGLVAAALLAALMSTVSGALNSIALLFSFDIVKRYRPQTKDKTLVMIGQIVTVIAMLLAIAWTPIIGKFPSIAQAAATMICDIAPPVTTVFLWGIFFKRASARGATLTLWSGAALGFAVFWLDFFKQYTGWNISFMMGSFYMFIICSIILGISSVLMPQQHTEQSAMLVWGHPLDALKSKGWKGLGNYKVLSVILLAAIITLYVIFR